MISLNQGRCEPLEFAVIKYSRHFLFPDMYKVPTPPDPEKPVVSKLYIELVGENRECSSYPKLSENPENEQCNFLQIDRF
jgi:hypothetical protein